MRYATGTDTDQQLTALLDSAQNEPVFIERGQQEVAVLLSAREYNRISGDAKREFLAFCDAMADRAAAHGLTEERFEEILKDA